MQQQKEMLEAALNTVSIGYEGANKYKVRVAHKSIVAARHCWVSPTLSRTRLTQVRDPAGRPMYFVVEDSGCCSRQCCNPNHSMTLQVTDMTGEREYEKIPMGPVPSSKLGPGRHLSARPKSWAGLG